jgi:hypothetical protein
VAVPHIKDDRMPCYATNQNIKYDIISYLSYFYNFYTINFISSNSSNIKKIQRTSSSFYNIYLNILIRDALKTSAISPMFKRTRGRAEPRLDN